MSSKKATSIFQIMASLIVSLCIQTAWPADMEVWVDATDLPRGLIKTQITFQVTAANPAFYYPEWVPGTHSPSNPIQNLAEVSFLSADGASINWQRDPQNVYTFIPSTPAGTKQITAKTTYLCNQPVNESMGIDSFGFSLTGMICWNNLILYPKEKPVDQITARVKLTLPKNWKFGTALQVDKQTPEEIWFETVPLPEFIDNPLICGQYYKKLDLSPANGPKHWLHLISESEQAMQPSEKTIQKFKNAVQESMALFGKAHFPEYHFLLILSDLIPHRSALEHLRCSINSEGERGLIDEDNIPETGFLLTHEYTHSWCGKYHTPAGLIVPNFNTPADTHLLWVYEGLDTYLGLQLVARSGLYAKSGKSAIEETRKFLVKQVIDLRAQKGRRSINLEDTATSSYLRRAGSPHWRYLNRPQDYYYEGWMVWLEIDAIIRHESDGKKSLDPFVQRFLGNHDDQKAVMGYTEDDVIANLNAIIHYDWKNLIEKRVRGRTADLSLDFLDLLGYRLQFTNKPTDYDTNMIFTSLGMTVGSDGTVQSVVPGEPADKAKLYEGLKIMGVNKKKFSTNRLQDAIAASLANKEIELLVLKDDSFETIILPYQEGPRFYDLVRNDKTDLLQELWKPIASNQ